ncbi:helix-turn-helix transcriptional regulator [Agrobacterium larrymoorei]|uniref:helix-turn-helix transcriptional regulator n=1 Tax=Agrobacterium larrymoorei TaxID=160699 RepID=UPI0030BF40D3
MSDNPTNLVWLDSYLTLKEVTSIMKVATSTLYRWMNEGNFPRPVKLGENCSRWRVSDVKVWQDARESEPTLKKTG